MLISDSIPLLWLCYVALSLVVLGTGYLAIRWLPRLPKLVITGVVAGLVWMPAGFTLTRLEGGSTYDGLAPAVVVSSVAFLQHDGEAMRGALALLLLGAGIGAALSVMLWVWLRRRDAGANDGAEDGDAPVSTAQDRREPVIR
ncbi:hypothetical protein MHM84_20635 [Halomonas sp. McH1-25]|uniref:hypothetical protein n=1 Tax=unclassified Halomonas TaxID=2609666 RepID=UPI001EF67C76|nr:MULTISPECIES: hypothetical protein [unclassified Halomonas]MCG7602146.1 hypothetical protein [Halomonas sp. McH1-25]MCP1344534.1 hypothetical protein [Halomonas sp. FL8]MCP1360796.1 hypothetical protein [Halomonas sp. BBD45]MCP1365043.1 hypothetical protein [Halomonas sp. BBD48]